MTSFRRPLSLAAVLLAVLLAPLGLAAQSAPAAAAQAPAASAPSVVKVVSDAGGLRLSVDGRDFMVFGMNWDYIPVGHNYAYDLFAQPDDVIVAALDREMGLMRKMGVNAIRVYVGMPARWIQYIYEKYGIYTVLNHVVGRYGLTIDGVWTPQIDYSNQHIRALLAAQVRDLVERYKGTPGLLMWLLGNENNYALSWSSFEIEALPQGERDTARAGYLYSLFGEILRDVKAHDPSHPVAIANGDLQYIDLIARECKGLDVLGSNVYRGYSARDFFQKVHDKLGVAAMFTEFGSDAFDTKLGREDDVVQARYLVAQWREIYEQSAGKGRVGNAVGGFVFQWSDGWWKYKQETNLDVHDTNASWPNDAYPGDLVPGANNMNEEWWGICAKGMPDDRGLYPLYPRTAYYAMQQAFRLPPYAAGTDAATIERHFGAIDLDDLRVHYAADQAAAKAEEVGRVRLYDTKVTLQTVSTGGRHVSTPRRPATVLVAPHTTVNAPAAPAFLGFDHQQSFYVGAEVRPTDKVTGGVALNILGNVAQNPIDEISYERRGRVYVNGSDVLRSSDGRDAGGTPRALPKLGAPTDLDRLKVYQAFVKWEESWFSLDGFYRTGHYHWGYEGDFFGLYRDAYYGENVDIYKGEAPNGFEVTLHRGLDGLKVAVGPQLWWGANPAAVGKYTTRLGSVELTGMWQEDLARQQSATTSMAVPVPPSRKAALMAATRVGPLGLQLGGLWSNSTKVGWEFYAEPGDLQKVAMSDTWGGKAKLTMDAGNLHWYAQGAYMGLVADGGPDATVTFTGWRLKDSGSGNQVNGLTGFAYNFGWLQIAPNFLWQHPLVGPGPSITGGGARNIEDDAFSVRDNREQVAAELMLVIDPTPGTWMWQWDNDLREDAPFAASLDFVYRHLPTTVDAAFWFESDGVTRHAFASGVPAQDLWEVNARVVSAPRSDLRLVAHVWAGEGQANGMDPRVINRYGFDARITWSSLIVQGFVKVNDWGPYDYHRDFNLTFPLQVQADISYALGKARWLWLPQTRVGIRGTVRGLDKYSPRYVPDLQKPTEQGEEHEIRTYLIVTL